MKRPGKRFARILIAVLALPPLFWAAVVFLMPTGWVQRAVVASITKSTRQVVTLDAVRIKPFGGVELLGLRIASQAVADNPWLSVEEIAVDLSLSDLVRGRVEASACVASGLVLRVRRDALGHLEFGDILRQHDGPDGEAIAKSDDDDESRELTISLVNATIHVDDEPSGAKLDFTEVQALATITDSSAALTEFTGNLNGGSFTCAATLDRGMNKAIAAQVQARGVSLDMGTKPITLLVPLLAPVGDQGHAHATLELDADLTAHASSSDVFGKTLAGTGRVALDDLALDDSRILREVQVLLPVPTRGRLGSLRGQFAVADRRVTTSDTVLRVGEIPVNLSGWSDFDGRLDYLVRSEKLDKAVSKIASRLPSEARELLSELKVDDLATLTEVRVVGTIDHPKVESATAAAILPRRTANAMPPDRRSDKAKLKEAGRRLLDRVIR